MCLKIKKIKHLNHSAKIARKPIKCYKVLLYNSNGLITPVAFSCVPASSKVLVADNMKKHTYDPIIENGIHTFSTLKSAYTFCDSISVHCYNMGIFPAYIPKGTYYWIGKNHEYVSERIEFL